eukprot:5814880-Amphidinium_carterae.1
MTSVHEANVKAIAKALERNLTNTESAQYRSIHALGDIIGKHADEFESREDSKVATALAFVKMCMAKKQLGANYSRILPEPSRGVKRLKSSSSDPRAAKANEAIDAYMREMVDHALALAKVVKKLDATELLQGYTQESQRALLRETPPPSRPFCDVPFWGGQR